MSPVDLFRERAAAVAPGALVWARRCVDLWPVTPLGLAVGVVAGVALVGFGFGKLDLVLLVLGYGGVGLIAVAVLVVGASALGLWLWVRRTDFTWTTSTLETGVPLPTGFSVPSLWWFPLVQVRWRWSSPRAAEPTTSDEAGRLREHVTLSERGILREVTRRVVIQDAFGLARIAFTTSQAGPIEVLPHVGGLRRLPVLTSLTGGEEMPHPMGLEDGDRVELRRYVPGDSARFIHWKVFGRTRKLMVRVPERALSPARRTVAYLIAGPADEAAAGAARAAIEEEALGTDWQFGADGASSATSHKDDALHKVLASGSFEGASGSGLQTFLAEVDPRGPAALVVFAPPTMGSWVSEMHAISARRYGRVRVVVAVDAVHESAHQPMWRRWVFRPNVPTGVARQELEQVGRALGRLRCEVVIIDRVTGRVVGDGVRMGAAPQRAA